jgi:hypothetical protein
MAITFDLTGTQEPFTKGAEPNCGGLWSLGFTISWQ